MTYEIICAIIGLLVGAVVAWLLSSNRMRSKYDLILQETRDHASRSEGKASELEGSVSELRIAMNQQKQKEKAELDELRNNLMNERSARVKAETEAKESRKRLEDEKKLLNDAKEKLINVFKATASDTLGNSNREFLKLARENFDKILTEAKGDLGKRQEAISGLVKPLSESLKQFEEHVREIEKDRKGAYSGIEEHLKILTETQQQLKKETGNLVTALRTPQVRGRWGELTMKRVVELAGMSEHCDFTEQVSAQSEDGRIKPDMIVHLPSDREIVVDAKVSLDAYLEAPYAGTEKERNSCLETHARQIRAHMKSLGSKSYWNQFEKAPEFVVMFIPGESFLATAAHHDHKLIEDGMEKRVVIATPTTLIALLRAVAYGWNQKRIEENAQKIKDLGRHLYERMRTLVDHIVDIGKGLGKANESYNNAVGSIELRILPAARRFRELGVTTGDEIQILDATNTTLREPNIPELTDK
jgi:DNA recombination protein RmuC